MRRRTVLNGLAAATGAAAVGTAIGGSAQAARLPGPPAVTPADLEFRPRRLRRGSPAAAGLVESHVDRIVPEAAAFMEGPAPSHPGFVVLAARDGIVVEHAARGHAVRYASWDDATDTAVELPAGEWEPMREDTIFDVASISKLFTSVVAIRLVEEDALDLDAAVAAYLPEFAANDAAKAAVTVRQLLTHTAGLAPFLNLYSLPDNASRLAAIYGTPLRRPPGTGYEYSDLGLIALATAMERVTGETLDSLVAERITEPLGLTDTGYNPPAAALHRVAATEYQPWTGRGMIRGSVHDENAWSFGGVAGHAGIFSTARDLAVFGQMMLGGGKYGGTRILREESVRAALTNHNPALGPSAARGLGWQLDQRFYMDALTSPVSFGHTGYTGTSLVADPLSGALFVLLSNRVHPTRERGVVSTYRRAPARAFARSVPVRPARGRRAWFAGQANAAAAVLTLPLPARCGEAAFRLWYDTEPTDVLRVDASADGGTTWTPVPLELRTRTHEWSAAGTLAGFSGRRWIDVSTALPDGATHLRWTYTTDADQHGRGVYVDDVRAGGHHPGDGAFEAVGWVASRD